MDKVDLSIMQHDSSTDGWVARTLDDSFQQAEAVGMGLWQLVLVYAILVSDVSISRWLLLVPHVAVFAIAGLILARRAPAWPILPLMCVVLIVDYRAVLEIDSTLWFTCFWTSLIFTGMPVILLPVRRAVWFSLLALACTAWGQLRWHAHAGLTSLVVTVLTAVVLAGAMVVLMNGPRAYAADADDHEALAADERERLVLQRSVARVAAEDARVMHDTLINTLSVIAGGSGVVTTATAQVRERCRRDAEAVDALLRGDHSDRSPRFEPSAIATPYGIRVDHTGLDQDEVEQHLAMLPSHVARAVQGSVNELVRNAAKHSGADCVTLDVRAHRDTLVVAVSDDGRGFDGRPVPGRGLAESVVARSRDADVDVTIESTPGNGTTVTLTAPLHDGDTPPLPRDAVSGSASPSRVIETVQRTACWRFAVVAVGFGVVCTVVSPPTRPAAAYLMLATVAGAAWIAARACRDQRALPTGATAMVLAATPIAFLTGLASIDFGRSHPTDWPTIVMAALPIIVLITRTSPTAFYLALTLLLATATVTTYLVWHNATPRAAAVIPAGVVTQLAVISAWVILRHVMDTVGTQHQHTLRAMAHDRLERATRDRIATARARWVAAGARRSITVLRRIADGQAHPAEPDVQHECAQAERYLRQVLLLSPDLIHISPWIGRALSLAREKNITFHLRPAAVDTPDEKLAAAFGHVILTALDTLTPGAELSLGLYPGTHGPQALLVGPRSTLRNLTAPVELPAPYTLGYQQYETQDVVELLPSPQHLGSRRHSAGPNGSHTAAHTGSHHG